MNIVINACYGGFGLSDEAIEHYLQLKGLEYEKVEPFPNMFILGSAFFLPSEAAYLAQRELDSQQYKTGNRATSFNKSWAMRIKAGQGIQRDDKHLVQTVLALGDKANTRFSKLKIVEIPDDVDWEVSEYDGFESIEEKHRSWN